MDALAISVGIAVIVIICVLTLRTVHRDGYGPRPTRADYDTRRPEP